jgi:hypothetical protein
MRYFPSYTDPCFKMPEHLHYRYYNFLTYL